MSWADRVAAKASASSLGMRVSARAIPGATAAAPSRPVNTLLRSIVCSHRLDQGQTSIPVVRNHGCMRRDMSRSMQLRAADDHPEPAEAAIGLIARRGVEGDEFAPRILRSEEHTSEL